MPYLQQRKRAWKGYNWLSSSQIEVNNFGTETQNAYFHHTVLCTYLHAHLHLMMTNPEKVFLFYFKVMPQVDIKYKMKKIISDCSYKITTV